MAHRTLVPEQDRVGEAYDSKSERNPRYPLTQSTSEGQLVHRASHYDGHTAPSPESLHESFLSEGEGEGDDVSIDSMRYTQTSVTHEYGHVAPRSVKVKAKHNESTAGSMNNGVIFGQEITAYDTIEIDTNGNIMLGGLSQNNGFWQRREMETSSTTLRPLVVFLIIVGLSLAFMAGGSYRKRSQ